MLPADCQQAYEVIAGNDELSVTYSRASACLKMVCEEDFWKTPQGNQMRQVADFVEKTLDDYKKTAGRIEGSIPPAEGSRMERRGVEPPTLALRTLRSPN